MYSNEISFKAAVPQIATAQNTFFFPKDSRTKRQIIDDRGTRLLHNSQETTIYPNGPNSLYNLSTPIKVSSLRKWSTLPTQSAVVTINSDTFLEWAVPGLIRTHSLQPYVQENYTRTVFNRTQSFKGRYADFGEGYERINSLVPLSDLFMNKTESPSWSQLSVTTSSSRWDKVTFSKVPGSVPISLLKMVSTADGDLGVVDACTISAWWVRVSMNVTSESGTFDSAVEEKTWLDDAADAVLLSPQWARQLTELYINITHSIWGDFGAFQEAFDSIFALALSNAAPFGTKSSHVRFNKTEGSPKNAPGWSDEQYNTMLTYLDQHGYH